MTSNPTTQEQAEAFFRQTFPNHPSEEQVTKFLASVGRALSAWTMVEHAVSEVYEAAIRPTIPGALQCAFHSVQTFQQQLGMADMAV